MGAVMKWNAYRLAMVMVGLFWGLQGVQAAEHGLQTRITSDNYTYSSSSVPERANLRLSLQTNDPAPNASIQVLIYAVAPTATASDGIADINAFDLSGVSVECPRDIPGIFEFSEPVIESAQVANYSLNDREYFHRITCPYTGTGTPGYADFGYTNDNYLVIKNLINPQNDPNEPLSQLIYAPIWASFTYNAPQAMMTLTSARSVKMLATVMPQLTLELLGVPQGGQYCGVGNDNETSGELANFGRTDNTRFANVVQELVITTNMIHGYVLTAQIDDQMRLEGQDITCEGDGKSNDGCIPQAQVSGMSKNTTAAWHNIDQGRGLAFSLQNTVGGDNDFVYTDGYRHFADRQAGDSPEKIISNGGDVHYSRNYVCYRMVPTDSNYDGTYRNHIYYTLTVKF